MPQKQGITTKNAKVMLLVGAAVLFLMAIVIVVVIALSPFFQIANVVSGGG